MSGKSRKAWRTHKKIKKILDKDIPTEEDIINKILSIENERNKYFILTLYYTGGRIWEVINFYKVNLVPRHSRMLNKLVDVLEIHMPNEKTRGKQDMKIVPLNLEIERRDVLMELYNYLSKIQGRILKWGFYSKQRGWQILKEETKNWYVYPLNPHILRHIRTSHLTMRGYHPEVIRRLMGWQNLRMYEQHYSHLNISDLV